MMVCCIRATDELDLQKKLTRFFRRGKEAGSFSMLQILQSSCTNAVYITVIYTANKEVVMD